MWPVADRERLKTSSSPYLWQQLTYFVSKSFIWWIWRCGKYPLRQDSSCLNCDLPLGLPVLCQDMLKVHPHARHYRLVANIGCIQTAMRILKSLVLQSRPFPEEQQECSELTSIILWFCWHFFILFPLTFLLYVQSIIASFSRVIIFTYHQRWTLYYYLTVFLSSQIFQTSTLCITEDQVAPGLKSQQCPYWRSIPLWPFH